MDVSKLNKNEKKGIKISIYGVFGIWILFVAIMLTGEPITAFETFENSTLYSILIYLPVMILGIIVLRRLR